MIFKGVTGPLRSEKLQGKRDDGIGKYCPRCLESNVRTEVERYRNIQLELCSYHYWLMRGRDGGGVAYSLESYIQASKLHAFKTSLPLPEEMARMGER